MPKTRKQIECPVFGAPSKFRENVLPTYADLMKNYLWIRQMLLESSPNRAEPTLGNIAAILIAELKILWAKASIPVVSDQQILHLIKYYHDKVRNIKKPMKSRKNESQRVKEFKESAEIKLFDISACKCSNFVLCKCKNKVPIRERDFLLDQRSERKMVIGCVDLAATQKIKRSIYRKVLESKELPSTSKFQECDLTKLSSSSTSLEDVEEVEEESTFSREKSTSGLRCKKLISSTQMRFKLPSFGEACDRTGISDRSAAILTSAILKDIGLVTEEDSCKIVDRSKVRRERVRARKTLQKQQSENKTLLHGVYFDGRKDRTLIQRNEASKICRATVTEEHIVLVSEPGSKYFGHLSVPSGTAKEIGDNIRSFLQKNMDLSNLVAIGCDGTAVNTGIHNGVIRRLEVDMERPLQWFICLLHANELPLRHLMKHLDGETSGPSGFSGEIGKKLESCEHLSVTKFQQIVTTLPEIDPNILSTDQKYLYQISLALSEGNVSESLAHKQPGKMAHSRWITTANRVLRLYVGSLDPSENLKALAEYIQKVYVPTWFAIKAKPEVKYGPVHLYGMIQRSRYLPLNLRKIVDKIIQVNGYFAHPENILLGMLGDERGHIRQLGLRRILKVRTDNLVTSLRKFKVPTLNFEANDYIELINWQAITVTEPPITKKLSTDQLRQLIENVPEHFEILKFPCHSQAVERCVRLVTEASASVCGSEARDGFIRCRISSRQLLPKFETKSDFGKTLK